VVIEEKDPSEKAKNICVFCARENGKQHLLLKTKDGRTICPECNHMLFPSYDEQIKWENNKS